MALASVFGTLGKTASFLGPYISKLWRKRRYRARASLALSWENMPIFFPGRPSLRWRAIMLTVVASKDEEFIIVEGDVQARSSGEKRWTTCAPLQELLQLPVEVAKNRTWSGRINGGALAASLSAHLQEAQRVEMRVQLSDPHRGTVKSDILPVDLSELRREETR